MKRSVFALMATMAFAAISAVKAQSHSDEINSYALLLTDASMAESNCGLKFNVSEMAHVTADLQIQRPGDQKDINAAELHWTQIETESLGKDRDAWCTAVWGRFGPGGTSTPMILIKPDASVRPAQ